MDIMDAALNINKNREDDILARLTTVWGENLSPDHVLEEYPRPHPSRLCRTDSRTVFPGKHSVGRGAPVKTP